MSNTKFSPSIDSRPIYAGLTPGGSGPAIMVADEAGAAALTDLFAADRSMPARAQVILVGAGDTSQSALRKHAPAGLALAADLDTAIPVMTQLLATAHMGTRMYLAGSEGLLGRASATALSAGLPLDAIEMEHRGPIARRMQCVHCKGFTDDVITDPFRCSHCGLTLFVRDHFSRRLGAFQAVCVDAETPGIVPAPQEIQP
ncbi:dimethylamine monooxygenase subunit DmmA family protein [Sagittula sp. SSi028]|uniref:dimethylamine monooxygenase subunit DmmA family protein n=1 Tax=Sagittula sp. SSi028 TaxID=3400636 RepID=UPI003AF724B5